MLIVLKFPNKPGLVIHPKLGEWDEADLYFVSFCVFFSYDVNVLFFKG